MALMSSNDLPLGIECPDFSLKSVDGKPYSLASFESSQALLVAFICNHCPYVKAIEDRILAFARAFDGAQLQVVAICSNDPTFYPEDSPSELLRRWKSKEYGFPYLVDETQDVAKRFHAACTPDLFLFNEKRHLYYHGQLDDNWRDASNVTRHDLKEALDALLLKQPAPAKQVPTIGCSIKWRKN